MAQSNGQMQIKKSLQDIISAVCRACHLEEDELCGPSRKRLLAEARAIAGWLVTEVGKDSLAELARKMNQDASA